MKKEPLQPGTTLLNHAKDNNYQIVNQNENQISDVVCNEAFLKNQINELTKEINSRTHEIEKYRITDTTAIPEPEPVIKINGEIIATVEDIAAIIGAPKSGKSSILYIFISGAICNPGTSVDGMPEEIQVLPNHERKAVVHLDCEQARYKHQQHLKNIIKRAGLENCPDWFLSYNIRQLDIADYMNITIDICEEAIKEHQGIHSIWIDGGADFVKDVNDPDNSNSIVKFFEWIAIQYHTAVVIIVHTNPGTEKERGHFGSQVQRKSGGTLLVKEDGEFSVVEPKRLRYAGKSDIPLLLFRYDKEKGYHVGIGSREANISDPDAKARQKTIETWRLCQDIFSGQKSYTGEDSVKKIMAKKACQVRTAKGTFSIMNSNDMLIKGSDNYYRINLQYNNDL